VEGFATALLTLLEIPGVIVGVYLGSRHSDSKVQWSKTLKEVITGKTVLLLVGGLVIGFATTHKGFMKVAPFFIDLQNGFLALFLLHLGFMAGSNWIEIKKVGGSIAIFGILFPDFLRDIRSSCGKLGRTFSRRRSNSGSALCKRFIHCSSCGSRNWITKSKCAPGINVEYRSYFPI
jgi:hypothetical protein